MVIDFCPGGELFYHLRRLGRMTEEQARFYISEILLGLEYLHCKGIIYRDLKPENIILDVDGHVKITDFGLSKQNLKQRDRTFSFCGSPEYMSPEMLIEKGHGKEVDFYSLGALLYEMLTGLPPYYNIDKSVMYKNILQNQLEVPSYFSRAAKDLILSLLVKNPENRLGTKEGAIEIKKHPWFRSVSWRKVIEKKTVPPYRPNFRHSNFDSEYTSLKLSVESFEKKKRTVRPAFWRFLL